MTLKAKYRPDLIVTIDDQGRKTFTYKSRPIASQQALNGANYTYHNRADHSAQIDDSAWLGVQGNWVEPAGYRPKLNAWGLDANKWGR